jgi:Cu+-exporting ATPase
MRGKMQPEIEVINLDLQGMICAGCVSSVEKALGGVDGVELAEVNFALNRASVHYDPEIANPAKLESAVEAAGFEAHRLKDSDDIPEPSEKSEQEYLKFRGKMWLAIVFNIPLVLLAMGPMLGVSLPALFAPGTGPLRYGMIQLLLTLPVLWAGREFYSKGFSTLFHRNPNMDTLVAVGTTSAVGFSLWNNLYYKIHVRPREPARSTAVESFRSAVDLFQVQTRQAMTRPTSVPLPAKPVVY